MLLIVASFVYFSSLFTLKRFLPSLIMLSSIVLYSSSPGLFVFLCCELKKKKIKFYYTPERAF